MYVRQSLLKYFTLCCSGSHIGIWSEFPTVIYEYRVCSTYVYCFKSGFLTFRHAIMFVAIQLYYLQMQICIRYATNYS